MDPITPSTTRHCNLCNMTTEEAQNIRNMAIIFLGIEYTLDGCQTYADKETLAELFGKQPSYSELQYRQVRSRYLSKHTVSALKNLIDRLHDIGKAVGIVITSGWAEDGTTKQVCDVMFESQPDFAPYIIGRAPSDDSSWDPEYNNLKKEKKTSFRKLAKNKYGYELTSYSEKIRFWIHEHASETFVILRSGDFEEDFGSRYVDVYPRLTEDHSEKAFKVLTGSHIQLERPKKQRKLAPRDDVITLLKKTSNKVNEFQLGKLDDDTFSRKVNKFCENIRHIFPAIEKSWFNRTALVQENISGICYGIYIDFASQLLNQTKSLQIAMEKFDTDGARLKATFYHQLYKKRQKCLTRYSSMPNRDLFAETILNLSVPKIHSFYLKKTEEYQFIAELKEGHHAITIYYSLFRHKVYYIKNSEGTGLFFDSNYGFVKCHSPKNAQYVIKNIFKQIYPLIFRIDIYQLSKK